MGLISVAKWLAGVSVLLAIVLPLLLSHAIGGWTKEYTSSAGFATNQIGDQTGVNAIVTGANTGIGLETARELARAGATVFMGCRSPGKCAAAAANVKTSVPGAKVVTMALDLSSFKSIKGFAAEFNAKSLPLHTLVLNAGVMKSPGEAFIGQSFTYGFDTTEEGFEQHVGVNHIGHFRLTQLLMGALHAPEAARVVSVSSAAEQGASPEGIRFESWSPEGGKMPLDYEDGVAYGQSKLANVLFAKELAERMEGTGVTAYSCHPGIIATDLSRYMDIEMTRAQQGSPVAALGNVVLGTIFSQVMFTPRAGALTQLHLATADTSTLVNGGYYIPVGEHTAPSHPKAADAALRKQLWAKTEEAIASHL